LVTFYTRTMRRAAWQRILFLIVLLNPQTGQPLAIMDGRRVTEMRTAAISAVAIWAMSAQDARVLAILGSGVQDRRVAPAAIHAAP